MSRDSVQVYNERHQGRKNRKRNQGAEEITKDIEARKGGPERQHWTPHDLMQFEARTDNQRYALRAFLEGNHVGLFGAAGVGKTMLATYLASHALVHNTVDRIVLLRSAVDLRPQGFVPGDQAEKDAKYEEAFAQAFAAAFGHPTTYAALKKRGKLEFRTTGNLRSLNFDDAVIVCDEVQNCNLEELNTVITRTGPNSRLILCGDDAQCDLQRYEIRGLPVFKELAGELPNMEVINFTYHDNQRHPLVKAWNRALGEWYERRDQGKVAHLPQQAHA